MPQEEETPQNKTKVKNTDSALYSDVNNGQSHPVHVLKNKHLKCKDTKSVSILEPAFFLTAKHGLNIASWFYKRRIKYQFKSTRI